MWGFPGAAQSTEGLWEKVHRAQVHAANRTQQVPDVGFSRMAQSAHMGLWARSNQGLSWSQSGSCLECSPDLLLAHHSTPTSAETAVVHLGSPPMGPQKGVPGSMPWEPQNQERQSYIH